MNAPTPNGSLDPNNATPVEEQLELSLGQTPGIAPKSTLATGSANLLDEDEEENKKRAAALSAIHFLTWEELLEEIKVFHPDPMPAQDLEHLEKLRAAFDRGFGDDKFGIPKVVDGAERTNGHIFHGLAHSVSVFNETETQGLIEIFKQRHPFTVSDNTVMLAGTNGAFSVGKQGVHFHAAPDTTTGKLKEFTQEDAKNIAILAMHNKDLLPPNAVALTGTPEQRAMIKAEMEQLNKMLPPHAQFIFDDAPKAPAPHNPSLVEVIGGKMGKGVDGLKRRFGLGGKPAPEEAIARGGPEAIEAIEPIDQIEPIEPIPAVPPITAMAETVVTPAAERPEAQAERAALEEVLNQFPQEILKTSEKVTEIDSQDVYKARIQQPSSDLSNMKDVLFIEKADKLKIIAIEGDGNFEKLLVKPVAEKTASELGEGFKPAATGVAEDSADFIGPPRPLPSPGANGDQPTPPTA